VGFKNQSTNRTNGNTVTTILAKRPAHRLIPKSGDYPPETTISKANGSFAQFFLAYPNASAAEHTLIRVISEQGTAGIYG
jgi:hypothetical protein